MSYIASSFYDGLHVEWLSQRNRISNEVRVRLVRSFEDPTEGYQMVADTLDVNRSAARGIFSR